MAKGRRRGSVKLLGVMRRPRPALLVSTALCATVAVVVSLPAQAQPSPNTLPTGGTVFGGSASISTSGNTATINQASQRAAINWQTFNIGSQAKVQFDQPNAAAVALNRVTTPNPSQIAGKLDANGQVIIENQSGVIFYKGSQVNTAGLMVSAASSSDAATRTFLNGGKLVTDLPANPNAAVINQGRITVKQAGLAALVAPQVRNDGVIVARLGHVVLASGTETTLDLYGDGLMSIDVSGLVKTLPNGATALVTNTGVIIADGGTVQLTAREADSIVQTLVDAGGKIRANTVGGHVGKITLAGVGGDITIEGQLQADGAAPGTSGGNIVVNPSGNVNVASTARISASGQAGGGVIALGTTLKRAKGGPSVTAKHTAANVYVASGAQIAANATRNGNGGRVTVLSTGTTVMDGSISATGGTLGGNGGFVEISGDVLGMNSGSVDVLAAAGTIGNILLDPRDLDIVTAGTNDGDAGSTGVAVGSPDQNTDITVSGSVLTALTGNLEIEASRNLTVDTALSFSNQTAVDSVEFFAGDNLIVNQPISTGGGSLRLSAATQITNGTTFANFNAGGSLAVNAIVGSGTTGAIILTAGTGGIALNANVTSDSTVNLNSAGPISQTAGSITATTLSGGSSGGATLTGTNAVGTLSNFSDTGTGNTTGLSFTNVQSLTVSDVSSTGPVTLTTKSSGISLAGDLTGGTLATVALNSAGTISQSGGVITAATLTGNAAGTVILDNGNLISNLGNFAVNGGNFYLKDNSALTVTGLVSVSNSNGEIYLESANPGGITIANGGTVSALGTGEASFQADAFTIAAGGSVATSNYVALAPDTASKTVSLGTVVSGDLSLPSTAGISTNVLFIGAVTRPGDGFGAVFTNAHDIAVGGSFNATGLAQLGLYASNAVTQTQPITGDISLFGSAASFTLLDPNNAIGAINLMASGNIEVVDSSSLTLLANSTSGGNIYAASSNGSGITLDGVVSASGTVGIQADALTITSGQISAAAFELAPFSTGTLVTIGATGGSGLSLPNLTNVSASFVRIGAISIPGTASPTTTAGSIVVGGAFGSSSVALELDSKGGIDGSIGALTASTLSGSAGGDAAFTATNTIAALGNFADTGFSFSLIDSGSLAVTGLVDAANISLNAGTIGITDLLNAGTMLALGATAGISEASTATISAATLTSIGTIGGGLTLDGTANRIGTLGVVNAAGLFALVDHEALAIAGAVSTGTTGTLDLTTLGAGSNVSDAAGGGITTGTLTSSDGIDGSLSLNSVVNQIGTIGGVTASGAISILDGQALALGGLVSAGSSGTIDLSVNAGSAGVTQGTSGTLVAGVLTSSDGIDGPATFQGVANQIGTISGLSATGSLVVVDNRSLALAGLVSAGSAGAIDLTTTGAGSNISQTGSGELLAGVLTSSGGISGSASFIGSANQIGTLGAMAVAGGDLQLVDSVPLSVAGAVTAKDIFLKNTQPGGSITLASGGTLTATNSTPVISLIADNLLVAAGAGNVSAVGGTVALAPFTGGTTISLGGSVSNAGTMLIAGSLIADIDIGSGTLQIGSYIDAVSGAGSVTAGPISVDGPLNLGGTATLRLDSTGAITESASNVISAGTLVGSAGSTVSLANANTIGALGSFDVTSGNFLLNDADATGTVAVIGLVSGTTVDLGAPNAGIQESGPGAIDAAVLQSSLGAGGTVELGGTNAIGALGNFVVDNGTFHLSNSGSLSGMNVTGSVMASSVTLDGLSGTLAISNTISATAAGGLVSITDTGTGGNIVLNSGAVVSGPTVDLKSGSIALNGNALLGNVAALLDLTATSGGITEATTAAMLAATLQSSGGIASSVNLAGTNNTIATIGSLALNNGTFNLTDNGNLNVGTLTASSITIGDGNGTLTVTNSLIATSSVSLSATTVLIPGEVSDGGSGTTSLIANGGSIVETGTLIAGTLSGSASAAANLAGFVNGAVFANQVGTLGNFTAASFVLNSNTGLAVTGIVNGGSSVAIDDTQALTVTGSVISSNLMNLTGSAIAITGSALVSDGGSGTTDLIATNGTIFENATLIAGTLTGSAAAGANLAGFVNGAAFANQVSTLGNFTAASFVLNTGAALSVTGNVNGGTSVAIDSSQALNVTGSVISTNLMSLTGSAIAITGTALVTDGGSGTTDLVATGGTIFESATMLAGTLDGSATGSASFSGNNTIANVGSFGANGFVLNDGTTALGIGTVIGGTLASIAVTGTLTIATLVSAGTVDLAATTILIPGTVNATTAGAIDLIANGGFINETGTLIAATLSGSATGAADLAGANATTNQIQNLASFSANGFVLDDGTDLTINTLGGGISATVLDSGSLSVGGIVAASTISLTAGTIAIPGEVTAGTLGTIYLAGTSGPVTETGTLIAGTLSGTSAAMANFAGASLTANQILTLGSFGSAGFVLDDGTNLTIDTLGGGAFATVRDAGSLAVSGIIAAGSISLTATTITVPGTVTAGTTGTIDLFANPGSITETGLLVAGTFAGSSTGTTDLANAMIGTLDSFSASAFTLNDGTSLTVAAPVIATTGSLTIADTGSLTNNATIQAATAATVSATVNVTNSGSVYANGGDVLLTAGSGTLTNGGLVQASANATLTAGTSLINSGSVVANGGNALLTAGSGSLTNEGLVQASANATLTAGTSVTNPGSVVANGGNALLVANNGTLSSNGLIQASANTTLQSTEAMTLGGVVNTAGSTTLLSGAAISQTGSLISAVLTGTAASEVNLLGASASANQVATLASFTATGFALNDGEALNVTGPVSGGPSVAIADAAAVTVNGNIVSTSAMSLSGTSLTINGLVTDGGAGTTSLTATAGPITEGGTLVAGTLSGGATGAASLTGATASTNQITHIANFSATNVTLQDGASLTATGPVTATSGTLAIATQGALTNNSTIRAATSATVTGGAGISNTNTGSIIAQNGNASIAAPGGVLSNSGVILASTNATLTGGSGIANTNTGSIIAQAGNASLTASNGNLSNSGAMSAGGTLSLTASHGAIIQSGAAASMVAGAEIITNAAGGISLDGLVKDDTGVVLNSGGNITQDGILIADLLTGSAAGTVNLLGANPTSNQVATLAGFTSNGAFALNDGTSLTIAGPVTVNGAGGSFTLNDSGNVTLAGAVSVTGAGSTFTLNNSGSVTINNIVTAAKLLITTPATIFLGNGGFVTGGVPNGTPLPITSLGTNALPFLGNAPYMGVSQGAWLKASNIIQSGNVFTVTNFNGIAESVLLLDLTPNSTASMLHFTDGLQAPATWAIFDVGNGQANGTFNVERLDFIYTQPPGTAAFVNSMVGGDTGNAAAGAAFIQPQPNANFRIDSCPIHSVNCAILTTLSLPTANPLNDIILGTPANSQNQEDLVLPVVSDERYELLPCTSPNEQGACDEAKGQRQ